MFQTEAAPGKNGLQVGQHLSCLCLDPVRIGGVERGPDEGHLARDEDPAVDLDRMAERGDRIRRAIDHVKERSHRKPRMVGFRMVNGGGTKMARVLRNARETVGKTPLWSWNSSRQTPIRC